MSITRLGFLQSVLAATAAAAVYDPDLALWVPGAKTTVDLHVARPALAIGDWVYWDGTRLPQYLRAEAKRQMHGQAVEKLSGSATYAYIPTLPAHGLTKCARADDNAFGIYCGHSHGEAVIAKAGNFSAAKMRELRRRDPLPLVKVQVAGPYTDGFARGPRT